MNNPMVHSLTRMQALLRLLGGYCRSLDNFSGHMSFPALCVFRNQSCPMSPHRGKITDTEPAMCEVALRPQKEASMWAGRILLPLFESGHVAS